MEIFRRSELSPRKLRYRFQLKQGHQILFFNVIEKAYRLYPLFKLKSISLISTLGEQTTLDKPPCAYSFSEYFSICPLWNYSGTLSGFQHVFVVPRQGFELPLLTYNSLMNLSACFVGRKGPLSFIWYSRH